MDGKTIYLIRHGHIKTPTQQKTYVGQIDWPLSAQGRQQGAALAEKFGAVKLDGIYTSDLSRCVDTAQPLAQSQGLVAQKHAGLREISLGQWEGLTFRQVARRYPLEFEQRGQDMAHFCPPGGESFAACQLRALAAYREIIQGPGANIAIVAHAGVNRLLLCHILGMPVAHLFRLAQDYAGINIILLQNHCHRVQAINTNSID